MKQVSKNVALKLANQKIDESLSELHMKQITLAVSDVRLAEFKLVEYKRRLEEVLDTPPDITNSKYHNGGF